jgi:hypothetical protein
LTFTKSVLAWAKSRLLEYSTLRGIVWILAGLLQARVTDLQVNELVEALLAALAGGEVSPEAELMDSNLIAILAQFAIGALNIAAPDGVTWRKSDTDPAAE